MESQAHNTWFTSDTHFDHFNLTKYCPRTRGHYNKEGMTKTAVSEAMTNDMVAVWNSRVGENDVVYHTGDFAFIYGNAKDKLRHLISRLNGRIFLTLGNHDEDIINNRAALTGHPDQPSHIGRFADIRDYREINIAGQKICIFHFPMAIWHKNHKGAWHLYGHCHGSYPGHGRGKTMDIGWDTNDLGTDWVPGPISFAAIKQVMDKRAIVALDHHDPGADHDM
jgi:calcineurin-like phosphoesterase family protein